MRAGLLQTGMAAIPDSHAWKKLNDLSQDVNRQSLSAHFDADPSRAERYSVSANDLYFDYARQRVTDDVLEALHSLARATDALGFVRRMMAGEIVNDSENRAALHTACRGTPVSTEGIANDIAAVDARLEEFVSGIHARNFRHVIVIGIGGSELGPASCVDALRDVHAQKLDIRFCANIDGIAFARAISGFSADSTLVVVVSKSFTTLETAANAARAKSWLQDALGDAWPDHVAAVSTNLPATREFGVPDDHVFPIWDWVGGRFSLWSAVGLPVALAYGWDVFQELRAGARVMDAHVMEASPGQNIPLFMAMLTVWNTTFLGYQSEACVPYDTRLRLMVAHLQQLQMESNGKQVKMSGERIDYPTQPVVFGDVGTNAQHAFFQQLHQGTVAAPVDILIPASAPTADTDSYASLVANALAQADALAFGRTNIDEPHRHYPGDRPSSILLYRTLTPQILGQLIALYEHKTVLAAAMWGINPFDQWGVELGKTLSQDILSVLQGGAGTRSSLVPLIGALKNMGFKA